MSVEDALNKGVTGGGARPPADAPVENAEPLKPETVAAQRHRAQANERELKPFNPKPTGRPIPPMAAAVPTAAPSPQTAPKTIILTDATDDLIASVFGSDAPPPAPGMMPTPPDPPAEDYGDPIEPLTAEDRKRMPAASDTDTPSKGLLPSITPPLGKEITGGWGDLGDAQYFPLTGEELRQLILAELDTIAANIANDLRFSMALTYPRIRAVVRVEVEGHAEDDNAGFTIQRVIAPKEGTKGGTPLEVARRRADQIVFVVEVKRQEFSDDGESSDPPDKMRDELGLPKPQKRIIDQGYRQSVVDIEAPGLDSRAVTR